MQKTKTYLASLVVMLLIVSSCQEDMTESTNAGQGSIEFRFQLPTSENARLQSDSAAYVLISVNTSEGEAVVKRHKLKLYRFNDEYISEPIAFGNGNYQLIEYFVLDQKDQIIYATPKAEAKLDYLVSQPLPIDFSISKDQTQKVTPQVVATHGVSAANFGYATFAFSAVETRNLMISVFAYDSVTRNFALTRANLDIAIGSEQLFEGSIGDSTNYIIIPDKASEFTITVSKTGYGTYKKVLSYKEIQQYSSQPLVVTLITGINDGLIAYYPFSGNAKNSVSSDYHGTVEGAMLAADISGDSTAAYNFDGIDDRIDVGDKLDLRTSDFTISLWVYVDEFKGKIANTSSYGGWVLTKGITIYGSPTRAGYGLNAKRENNINYFQFYLGDQRNTLYKVEKTGLSENVWYHITMVKHGQKQNLYIDGTLAASGTIPSNFNVSTNIPLVFGSIDKLGNDPAGTSFFDGRLDEIKFYKRALSAEEVADLANN